MAVGTYQGVAGLAPRLFTLEEATVSPRRQEGAEARSGAGVAEPGARTEP